MTDPTIDRLPEKYSSNSVRPAVSKPPCQYSKNGQYQYYIIIMPVLKSTAYLFQHVKQL